MMERNNHPVKISWVTRSFLDYRIPVFENLNQRCGGELTLIYNADYVPARVDNKIRQLLGDRAIGLHGEKCLGGGDYAGRMANQGIRIPYQSGLQKVIRQTKPEVLITDGFMQWTCAALWYRMFHANVAHVMCYERTFHTERDCQWYRKLYRKAALHWIDVICCNGSLCREYVRDGLKFPDANLTCGHMAADTQGVVKAETDRDRTRQRYGLNGITFIFVGRLIPLKGLKPLLDAWHIFCGQTSEKCHLLVVGDGEQRAELEAMKSPGVLFLGNCDYDKIGYLYHAADIFIIPTLEDNWSLVVPEAMTCGLPVASSVYNGCHPELVHPDNGWVFDPLNIDSTVDMLHKIVQSKDDLRRMGEVSRQIVNGFTPAHAGENIYQSCLLALKNRKEAK